MKSKDARPTRFCLSQTNFVGDKQKKLQAPSSKNQRRSKLQPPIECGSLPAVQEHRSLDAWCLGFLWSLVLGSWSLIRGVWILDLGASLGLVLPLNFELWTLNFELW